MTLRELMILASQNTSFLVWGFALIPLLTLLLGILTSPLKRSLSPLKYIYSVLTYLVCIPGICALVLVAYALFFTNENLLDANVLIYFMPLVAMFITLPLIGKQVSFSDLPGFQRLSGLMVLIGISFGLVLFVKKLFIGIFFGGGIGTLLLIGVGVFLLLKWAVGALFQSDSDSRKRKWPSFSK